MTSRRRVLSGLATVAFAGASGCSALPFGSDEQDGPDDVSLSPDMIGSIEWPPSPFPITVPAKVADSHEERARELLAAVPEDPDVPNSAVAASLQSDREHAADRLTEAFEEPWPREQLSEWRSRREAAATVRGAYRAAIGEDDAEAVANRRETLREVLHSFIAAHEYRASSPIEAVLAHAPLEDLIADCRRRVRPTPVYPSAPVSEPFQAGDAVGRVEHAQATLTDARRLREAYLSERTDPPSQWSRLIESSDRLRFAVHRTQSSVREFLDADERPFRADLSGTAGRWLYDDAKRRVESAVEDHDANRADGNYATAVVEAGQALAAIEAFRTVIDGLREGAYQEPVTAESVRQTAARAREALEAIETAEDRRLAALIARPVLGVFAYGADMIEDGYADPVRMQAELARAELYARAVPAATAFVLERLESGTGR
ncbi:hypothetical protein [Halobellus marinus]|uniref:hypothetical protein n=1 Tax=Halobellus TaxID=1073986 RepID=UPI0028AA1F0E|nr:hypothetical protein [Halobellus sp. DFY28]